MWFCGDVPKTCDFLDLIFSKWLELCSQNFANVLNLIKCASCKIWDAIIMGYQGIAPKLMGYQGIFLNKVSD